MGRHVQREVVVCALARDGELLGIGVEVARVLDDPFIGRVGVLVLRREDRARSLPVGGQDHHRVRAGGQGTGRSVVDVDAGDHPTQPPLWKWTISENDPCLRRGLGWLRAFLTDSSEIGLAPSFVEHGLHVIGGHGERRL
jgi:hypothetical protein